MKCNSCGATFDDEKMRFCTVCGAKLEYTDTKETASDKTDDMKATLADNAQQSVSDGKKLNDEHEQKKDNMEISGERVKIYDENPSDGLKSEDIKQDNEAEQANNFPAENIVNEGEIKKKRGLTKKEKEKQKKDRQTVVNDGAEVSKESADETTGAIGKVPEKAKKVGAGRFLGAFAIALFAVIVFVSVSLLLCIKISLSPEQMSKSIKNMNAWKIINAQLDDETVSDAVYDETDFGNASHGFADKSEFALYLSKTELTDFLSEKVRSYADYILNGKGDEPKTSENEITDFFMTYDETAKDVFSYDMQMADYNSIRKTLAERKTPERFSIDGISREINFNLKGVKYILSDVTINILMALFIVLLIWIAIAVNRKGKYILGFYGNVFTISGIVIILIGFIASPIMALMYVIDEQFLYLSLSLLLLPTAVFTIIIGLIIAIIGIILKRIRHAVKAREKIKAK